MPAEPGLEMGGTLAPSPRRLRQSELSIRGPFVRNRSRTVPDKHDMDDRIAVGGRLPLDTGGGARVCGRWPGWRAEEGGLAKALAICAEGEAVSPTARVRQWRDALERVPCRQNQHVAEVALLVVCLVVGWFFVGPFAKWSGMHSVEFKNHSYGSNPSIVGGNAREVLNEFLRVVCTFTYVLGGLGAAIAAACGITSEREQDTWISLISTPLSGEEIVRAKMIGAAWRMRWLGGFLVGLWTIGLICGAVHPIAFVAVAVETDGLHLLCHGPGDLFFAPLQYVDPAPSCRRSRF